MGTDNAFNPSIAALAMPQNNELKAVGDSMLNLGKYMMDTEDHEAKRELVKTQTDQAKQSMDFASKMFPKQMEEADLKIVGQTTANKSADLAYQSADDLYKDKKINDYMASYIKSNKVAASTMQDMVNNQAKDPNSFKFKDPLTGDEYQIEPKHITSAFDAVNKDNLAIASANADINAKKAQASHLYMTGQAAMMNAETNANKAANISLTTKNADRIAQNAMATSELANGFKQVGDIFRKDIVGGGDSLMAGALNTVGINTKDTTANRTLQATTESLKSLVKDIYNVKGSVSNKDMQRIDAIAPTVWDNENTFKAKTIRLIDDAIAGYKSKMATYDPNNATPVNFQEWRGNIAALVNTKQTLLKKFDESGSNYRESLGQEYMPNLQQNTQSNTRSIKTQTQKTVVRTGTDAHGNKVVQYSDGSIEAAQ